MKKFSTFALLLTACLSLALFSTGCEDQKKIDEANKFVESANKKANEAKDIVIKAGATSNSLMDQLKDLEEDKPAHLNELKDLAKTYDKALELQKGVASDFTEASKLNANEKFKAYYEMSSKNAIKTGEIYGQGQAVVQALLDSNDIEAFTAKMDAINAKSATLKKEGDDISAQLKTLEAAVAAINK